MTALTSYEVGTLTAGLECVLVSPLHGAHRSVPIVYTHSSSALASEAVAPDILPGIPELLRSFADYGFLVVAPDLDLTWGADPSLINDALAYAASVGADQPPILMGASHGSACSVLWAHQNPGQVAGVVGLLPPIDVEYLRENYPTALRPVIDAAWGVTYPDPLPAGADVLSVASDVAADCYFVYASDDDISHNLGQFIAAHGDSTADNVGALGHTGDAVQALDLDALLQWVQARSQEPT